MKRINLLIFVILLIPLFGSGQDFFTLSGIISDSISGKQLENIDIVVENSLTGTISNYCGAYILYLPKGNYKVKYSANGYIKQTININLNYDQVRMVEMAPKSKILKNKDLINKRLAFLKKKQPDVLLSENLN